MTTINFGFEEFAYETKANGRSVVMTTGEVAEILEHKYGIVGYFWETHKEDIFKMLHESVVEALDAQIVGKVITLDPTADAAVNIQNLFKKFLADKEMDLSGIPGIPTMASILGVNHRLSQPKAKSNPIRPSFIDTGLYASAFRVYITS